MFLSQTRRRNNAQQRTGGVFVAGYILRPVPPLSRL